VQFLRHLADSDNAPVKKCNNGPVLAHGSTAELSKVVVTSASSHLSVAESHMFHMRGTSLVESIKRYQTSGLPS
jgi:hypothetical protein